MARDRSAIRICRWGNAARCSEGDGRGRIRVGRWAARILFHAGLAAPATTKSARLKPLPQEPNSSAGRGYAPAADLTARRPRSAPRSEEHTSELQSLMRISYAVFCLKKKKKEQQKR